MPEGVKMLAAAVQMSSSPDKDGNKDVAERLIRSAAGSGARLVALPEMWSCYGLDEAYRAAAETIPGPTTEFLAALSRELGLHLLGGSILESVEGAEKMYNTSALFDPSGKMTAVYRKIHLFDVKAPDREYLESASMAPGSEAVTAGAGETKIGLSVCYDLRFPELYRALALDGAEVLTVPSAFTLQTGKDHWELLLRARAVENQAYVIAPNQWGRSADGRSIYGRSMIVDPWGTVLSTCPDRDGYALAELDFGFLRRFRADFPSLANRRPEAYPGGA